MQDGFISKQIVRGNRNYCVAGVFICIVWGLFFVLSARATINDILGPVPMSPQAVVAIKNPSSLFRYNISTTGDKISGALWEETSDHYDRKTGKLVTSEVLNQVQLLGLNGKLVLVRRFKAAKQFSATGALVSIPASLKEFYASLESGSPQFRGLLLPLLIDETRFTGTGVFPLILGLPVLLMGLFFFFRGISRVSNIDKHPTIAKLSRLGDPRLLVGSIEEEVRLQSDVLKTGALTLTPNWIMAGRVSGLDILNLKELVWVYPKVTTNSVNFIPLNKDHEIIVCDSNGNVVPVSVPGRDVDKVIAILQERAPWAFYGFFAEYKEKWEKKNRSSMIAEVNERMATAGS